MGHLNAIALACARAGILRAVGHSGFRALAATAQVETLPADRILWHDDAPSPPVGLLLDGYLRYQRCGVDGRRQILNLVRPGEVVGFETARSRGYTLETATPVTLCRVPNAAVARLQETSHALRAAIYGWQDQKLERLRWLTWAIGALATDERICAFLASAPSLLPAQRLPSGRIILSLSLTRRDTADLLATSVESICRVLKELEREGLVRPLRGRRLLLREPAALRLRSGQRADALDLAFAARATSGMRAAGGRRIARVRPEGGHPAPHLAFSAEGQGVH